MKCAEAIHKYVCCPYCSADIEFGKDDLLIIEQSGLRQFIMNIMTCVGFCWSDRRAYLHCEVCDRSFEVTFGIPNYWMESDGCTDLVE